MRLLKIGVLTCGFIIPSSLALAAPLNLVIGHPDLTSGFLSATFVASTHLLTVTGTALALDFDGVSPPDYSITSGTFTLHATISTTGAVSAATLSITGTIPALPASSPLLAANLTNFGFAASPLTQVFEFTGPVTGGSLAGSMGSTIGVILDLSGGFAGNFTSNWHNGGFGAADTARLPTPGAGSLALIGAAVAASRRRRHEHN